MRLSYTTHQVVIRLYQLCNFDQILKVKNKQEFGNHNFSYFWSFTARLAILDEWRFKLVFFVIRIEIRRESSVMLQEDLEFWVLKDLKVQQGSTYFFSFQLIIVGHFHFEAYKFELYHVFFVLDCDGQTLVFQFQDFLTFTNWLILRKLRIWIF